MLRASLLVLTLAAVTLAGCIGQDPTGPAATDPVPFEWPEYPDFVELPATITGLGPLAASEVPSGSGMWVDGDHAYVGARNDGFFVVDITDPAKPVITDSLPGLNQASAEEGGIYGRDVDLIKYDDGRKVAVVAGQSAGMFFVDVTDPANITLLSFVSNSDIADHPTHNVAVVPGTTYVFNSPSGGTGRTNHLLNVSDPEAPTVVGNVGEHGCHDIAFYTNAEEDKFRAYCAGRDNTEIWDIADLMDVKIITQMQHTFVDNGGGLHHLAMVNQDASILIIGDEFRGGNGPGCQAHVDGAGLSASTPLGALWFFDIAGDAERNPRELGHFSPMMPLDQTVANNMDYPGSLASDPDPGNQPGTSCTSHFGSFVGDTDILAMAWYYAGVILIDLSDPSNPIQVDQWNDGTNTWDVRYHRGLLFTGDIARGLDVLKLV